MSLRTCHRNPKSIRSYANLSGTLDIKQHEDIFNGILPATKKQKTDEEAKGRLKNWFDQVLNLLCELNLM